MLPDAATSAAVVVGVANYRQQPRFSAIPAATNNARAVARMLTGPAGGFLSPERCHLLTDPTGPQAVLGRLRRAAQSAEDTFLVYVAGHGEVDSNGQLHLVLKDTDADDLRYSALDFEAIREVLRDCPARRRLLIVDCCFSGRAIPGLMSGGGLLGLVQVGGTYTLASAGPNVAAVFEPGGRYTAFTGELVALFESGVPGGGEFITVDQLYPVLRHRLESGGYPVPAQCLTDSVKNLALAHNPAHAASNPAPHEPTPARLGPSWLAGVDHVRAAEFTGKPPRLPSGQEEGCAGWSLVVLLWASAVGLTAWDRWPSPIYLTLAGASALLLGLLPLRRRKWAQIVAGLVFVGQEITYCVLAVGAGRSGDGNLVAVLVVTALLLVAALGALAAALAEKENEQPVTAQEQIERSRLGRTLRTNRWLGGTSDAPVFDAMAYLPGARFIRMRKSQPTDARYVIVCGARAVAVFVVSWPAGSYRRMAGETREIRRQGRLFEQGRRQLDGCETALRALRKAVQGAEWLGLVLVCPATKGAVDVSDRSLTGDSLVVARADQNAEAIGAFLAREPYRIDLDVLQEILPFASDGARRMAGLASTSDARRGWS